MEPEAAAADTDTSPPNESSISLNIFCGICNEFFKPIDLIFSTPSCGHVFHKDCLTRWLYRSPTCPQCRATCHRNRIHRLYLNFTQRTDMDDEVFPKAFIQWVPMDPRDSLLPEGAIAGGTTDEDGIETYVARVYLYDDLLPAGYAPQKKAVRTPWNCEAHTLTEEVDILVLTDCDYKWVAEANGRVPANGLQTGYSELGEPLYTARGVHEGLTLLGKVHPSHRLIYMPFGAREVSNSNYEVLVVTPREQADR